ncbi:hypothetical protein [Larkinella rosea]|uniref:T9SS C-terminal target domain-containing protein n=1 Tax=Larkinella rosea TaxID=2025312 RepID=A0A3P1BD69_9BACT|nr:hypothetical protein [Larkinella rosea]RRA98722.1 hypothetical protein EHT25_27405 [Larkinella rosea]
MKRKIYILKNRKPALLVLALTGLFLLNSARAQTPEAISENAKTESAMKLSFKEVGNLRFRLEVTQPLLVLHDVVDVFIVSSDRQVLFANTYSHHALRITTFDLSTLQDGTYGFEIRSGATRIAQKFDIKTKSNRVILARN